MCRVLERVTPPPPEAAEPGGALGARAPPPTFLPRVWSALPALGYMLSLQCIRKECPEGQYKIEKPGELPPGQ